MKKILALAVAIAMLASMAVSAGAAVPTEATADGAIVFEFLPPNTQLPPLGGANPNNPGTLPGDPPGGQGTWPPFPNDPALPGDQQVVQPVDMQSWSLHFGRRDLPDGTPGPRGWASHPNVAVTTGGITAERPAPDVTTLPPNSFRTTHPGGTAIPVGEQGSLLGLLWNAGAYGITPNQTNLPLGNNRIDARMGDIRTGHTVAAPLGNATMSTFELTLFRHGNPGFRSVVSPVAAGFGGTAGFNVPNPAAGLTLVQGTGGHNNTAITAAPVTVAEFQTGFIGIEWSGILAGTWDGNNVVDGASTAHILFTHTPNLPNP